MSTTIEWTDETWNPTLGCDRVSPGCDKCYAVNTATIRAGHPNLKIAAAFDGLTHKTDDGLDWTGRVNSLEDRLKVPLRWKRPRRVFVNSLSDLFHDDIPETFIAKVFAVMAGTPQHTYQVLTKRQGRMKSLLNSEIFRQKVMGAARELRLGRFDGPGSPIPTAMDGGGSPQIVWPLPNIWVGVSVEDQKWADIRIPALLQTPAAVRFLSCEPMLGSVDLTLVAFDGSTGLTVLEHSPTSVNLVIAGGESGPGARPMDPAWARSLRDQCTAAGTAFFFKQWGAWVHRDQMPDDTFRDLDARHNLGSDQREMWNVGKKRAGRLLDGRTWDEMPSTVTA